ncbi:TonB-dependent receptor [Govanella unica]|uniref:TonB-dependent receptor n=1 Tax=Govanella unica TaxID=2975056 RepID=A0A9X3TVM8_9PROT|nr:TonB-dependent receptor [Govania unica]MDA5192831.1 TonB-dependent receptor [Govania unica]
MAQSAAIHNLEEIIVTAKQRSETLQEVPLAITVFNQETIDKIGMKDARDLAQFTPSLIFFSSTGRNDASAIIMRGLSANTTLAQFQGVSIFIDGIPVSGQLSSLDLSELERVEVIKGPQSATFGRATYAGAIDFISKTPESNDFTGRVRAEMSTHHGSTNYDVGLAFTTPLVQDKLWLSMNASSKKIGSRSEMPDGRGVGGEKTDSFGVSAYFKPTDQTSFKLRVAYDSDHDETPLIQVQTLQEWQAAGVNLMPVMPLNALGKPTGTLPWFYPNGSIPNPVFGTTGCDGKDRGRPSDCGNDRNRWFVSLIAEHEFDNGYELSYRGGYYNQTVHNSTDFTYRSSAGDPFFSVNFPNLVPTAKTTANVTQSQDEYRNHSHQIRLISPGSNAFRWRVGGFYSDDKRHFIQHSSKTTANPTGQPFGDMSVETYSVFGGASYDLTSRLTAEVEARYQIENVTLESCPTCTVNTPGSNERSKAFLPRVTAQFKASDDVMIYALYSYGTKSGRINTSRNAVTGEFTYVDPEKLDNYEFGVKSNLFGGRALLNIAGFYQNVRDQQFSTQIPGSTSADIANVGKSRIYGFEVDAAAQVTNSWLLTGNVGYANHRYDSDFLPGLPTNADVQALIASGSTLKGKTSVNLPRWTAAAASEYSFPVASYEGRFRVDVSYLGERYGDIANLIDLKPVTRVNAKLSVGKDAWEMSLFVKDLFDNKRPLGTTSNMFSCLYPSAGGAGQRCLAVAIPRGRELGANVNYRF